MKNYIYIGIILVLAAFICLKHCNAPEQKDNALDTLKIEQLKRSQEALKEADSILKIKDSIILSQDNIISSRVIEVGNEKKINGNLIRQIAELKHKIKAPEIQIKYVDRPVIKEIDKTEYIKIPQKFSKKDKYITLKGEINKDGIKLKDPELKLNETLVIAEKRDKWYKKKYIEATLYTDNPYDNIQDLTVYKYQSKKKWYQSNWLKFRLGFCAGALIF